MIKQTLEAIKQLSPLFFAIALAVIASMLIDVWIETNDNVFLLISFVAVNMMIRILEYGIERVI